MTDASGIRMKNPAHPGDFLKHEILDALELSVTETGSILGVTRPALLNERSSLSPETALRIEKAFGVSMDTLMRMQNGFDIAQARKREQDIHILPYRGKTMANPAE